MRYLVFIFLVIVCLVSCDKKESISPPNENYFLKYYGNEGNQIGVDLVVNQDGTIVVLGNSRKSPSSDQQVYVAKLSTSGIILWEKTFGLALDEEAKDIEIMFNNNLVIAGNSEKTKGERDAYVLILDQSGNKLDSVRQGLKVGSKEADDNVYSITEIVAGLNNPAGFIVSGSTTGLSNQATDLSDAMHLRFDQNLNWLDDALGKWKSRISFTSGGFNGEDVAVKIIQKGVNDYYVFGFSNIDETTSSGVGDFNFMKYGRTDVGEPISGTTYVGFPITNEKLDKVSLTSAQSGLGFLLTGISQNATDADSYIVKLNSPLSWNNSDISFTVKSDLPPGKATLQHSVNFASLTNGYLIASDQIGQGLDIRLSKLDNTGNILFERIFGGVGDDSVGAVTELSDGKILLFGTMTLGGVVDGQKKIVLIKLNAQGKLAP